MIQEKNVVFLLAEDDEEDYLLTRKAFENAQFNATLYRVRDGQELLDFLLGKSKPGGPLVVILDLNMPRKDGREALRELKSHPELKRLPVVILTTSKNPDDVELAYSLGVNSFIRKPFSFPELVEVVATLKKYWLNTVELPLLEQAQRII